MKALYWLSDAEWARIEPLMPRGRRGAHRVDDRRVISGIVYMLRCGARWRDCPAAYGPYTTIYNRFNRWSRQGIWFEMFERLTGSSGLIGTVAIDSSDDRRGVSDLDVVARLDVWRALREADLDFDVGEVVGDRPSTNVKAIVVAHFRLQLCCA